MTPKKNFSIFIILCMFMPSITYGLFDKAKTLLTPGKDQREEQLEHLKSDIVQLQSYTKEYLKNTQVTLDVIGRQEEEIKAQLKQPEAKDQDFLHKKLSLLNENQQILFNIQFVHKEILALVESHAKLLEEYLKDPGFKSLNLEERSFYTFDMAQTLNRKILYQEDTLNQSIAQKNDAQAELETRKKKLATATKDYQDKKKEQEEFGARSVAPHLLPKGYTFSQQGELLDLEGKRALYEKQLADLRVQESTRRLALLASKVFVETEKLKFLKENLEKVKNSLRVLPDEVQAAQEKLEKRKQESLAIKDARYSEINQLSAQRDKLKKDLEILAKRYGKTTSEAASWSTEPKTIENFSVMSELGYRNAQIALLDRKIESLRALIDLEEGEYRREEIAVAILSTWYKITQRKFRNNDEILQHVRQFKSLKEESARELTLFQDKRNASTTLLNIQNKELSNAKKFMQELQAERELIFKKYPIRYTSLNMQVYEAEKTIAEQIEINGKLIEVYSSIIATLDEMIKELNFMLSELEVKPIWQRSEYAISWKGFKNIIPDIRYFVSDVKQLTVGFLSGFSFSGLLEIVKQPLYILIIILALLVAVFLYVLCKRLLPHIASYLLQRKSASILVSFFSKTTAALVLFVHRYLLWLFGWFCLWLLIYTDIISDLFLRVLFYLFSIVYLIYFVFIFIKFIKNFNVQHNYLLFRESFERRFTIVTSLFLYSTIVVLFLREAFLTATVHKSEFPIILLAIYSLLMRALIIFSIGKEEVLALISTRRAFGSWLAHIIDTYYYPLLVIITIIMIMSDPYVGGYGNLVSFIMWSLIASLLLIKAIFWIQSYVKQLSSALFFYTDEEVMRERFAYAKTSYGIFTILLFGFLVVSGILLIASIWGVRISLKDIAGIIHIPLFETGFDKVTGQVLWFTPQKFLIVVSFIIGGFVIALVVNRIVFRAIFNVLPVDLGIQNTVTSITRYLILIAAIYLGFQWGGLGTLLIAISVIVGSIAYIVKEPFGDFISYFILLVQRPIQIGDYIFIDEENQGVVRKITARSVIVRRKDSYTIIIPNSMILNKPVCNWNYTKGFIAFDDIEFTIPYTVDPMIIKSLVARVLDENADILKSPKPIIRLHDFGEYGFRFKVRGFTSDINVVRKWDIASDVRIAIAKILRENGIRIAIPARITVRQDDYFEK
jgi:small-conductance mechanosensitive channel